jgi:hypothetical protein
MKRIKKIMGWAFAAWGAIRGSVDLLESVRATKEYAEIIYSHRYLAVGLSGPVYLTVAVSTVGGGLIFSDSIRGFWKKRHALELPPGASEPPPPEPTLLSLMDTSFPRLNKLWGKPVIHFEDNFSLQITSALYFDLFTSGAKFLGFYVPRSPRVLEVFSAIASHATELGDALGDGGLKIVCKAPGENPQTVSDLTYSGKVYLYHEDDLTHKQMADVEEIFKSQHLAVVLRGRDFLTPAWTAWKAKHGTKPPEISMSTPNINPGKVHSEAIHMGDDEILRRGLNPQNQFVSALLLEITNPLEDGRAIKSARVKAHLRLRQERNQEIVTCPAIWLNERNEVVEIPAGEQREVVALMGGADTWYVPKYISNKNGPPDFDSHSSIWRQDDWRSLEVTILAADGDTKDAAVLAQFEYYWRWKLQNRNPDIAFKQRLS